MPKPAREQLESRVSPALLVKKKILRDSYAETDESEMTGPDNQNPSVIR